MDKSSLYRLPLEVRELIYGYFFETISANPAFEKTTSISIRSQHSTPEAQQLGQHTWKAIDNSLMIRKASATSLLLLCKQVHREAMAVYWRRRSLSFNIESTAWPIRAFYHIQERIAAICCIRNYLLRLATTQPTAISGLVGITIRIFGFDHLDIAEIYDIMLETQKLLSNWRPSKSALPIWLNLAEDIELRLRENRPTATASTTPRIGSSTIIQFQLPVHDTVKWKSEVSRQIRSAKQSFSKLAEDYDKEWCTWCFELLEWSLLHFETDNQGCLLQRGCHCEKHIGRTQLAREFGQTSSRSGSEGFHKRRRITQSFG